MTFRYTCIRMSPWSCCSGRNRPRTEGRTQPASTSSPTSGSRIRLAGEWRSATRVGPMQRRRVNRSSPNTPTPAPSGDRQSHLELRPPRDGLQIDRPLLPLDQPTYDIEPEPCPLSHALRREERLVDP